MGTTINGTEQFQKDKEVAVYAKINNIIDVETGQIIQQTSEEIKTKSKEPDFVKIYLNTVMSFNGIKNITSDFLLLLCNYITYANNDKIQMRCILNKMIKEEMAQQLNIKINMIEKYIRKCVDAGILFKTEYRGTYIVNPFLFARGEWKNIKSLQTEFDFVNGTWKYVKKFKTREEQEQQEQPEQEVKKELLTHSSAGEHSRTKEENFEIIYALYPKKVGKAKAYEYYLGWLKGRTINGKKWTLTNKQMYLAVKRYVTQQEENEVELKFYKGFDTFMNKAILDYLEQEQG